jgi:murein tripeptide amidase MpaA
MLLPMLAEWLCANNGKDPRATRLVRDAHLFLVPTMNPDGFAAKWRGNRCAAAAGCVHQTAPGTYLFANA